MFDANVQRIMERLDASDKVLDIGGWAKPFNRANVVIDVMPYESRGVLGSCGPETEHFSADSWIVHDISSKEAIPLSDKEIDFAICSQTLEDIRDPIFLCSELNRVAKSGYIEVPSRSAESIMGSGGYVGACHHRWLVEIEGDQVAFRFKSHLIHGCWKYHLPRSYAKRMSPEDEISYLFWEGSFDYREVISFGFVNMAEELESFVRSKQVYPIWYYWLEDGKAWIKAAVRRRVLRSRLLETCAEGLRGRSIGSDPDDDFWRTIGEIESK